MMVGVSREHPVACRAWELLTRLCLERRVELPALAAEFDLSPVQFHVLHVIEPGQPVPMGRLAEVLSCDASNVTGLVDRLESRGLIERRPSATDRRVKVLVLTGAGTRLRVQLHRRLSAPSDPFRRLSADDQRMLVRILEKLFDERTS
jgi:DNA-binding MarR family transcriptional regulator